MKKLLNTLYVTIPEAYLACEGENVLVKVGGETRFRMPIHNLEGIICFGFAGASPALMYLCCERGVTLTFLTAYGRFKGRVTGAVSGNVLLRRAQYRIADDKEKSLALSKHFITAKIYNARQVLSRGVRDYGEEISKNEITSAIQRMMQAIEKIDRCSEAESLLGIEGMAASSYFDVFDELIRHQKKDFSMSARSRRPPLDPLNALLSYLYTLLTHEVVSALESVGLDPQSGYFHTLRPGRPSLALDLLEELRPYMADRMALTLINRKQVDGKGFVFKENGAVIMDEDTRKAILTAWQRRKHDEITHPYLKEKIALGLLPYVQAMLLARHIRGDIEDYPAFFWK